VQTMTFSTRTGVRSCHVCVVAAVIGASTVCAAAEAPPRAVVAWAGSEFAGGAGELFGSVKEGERVNYVYAEATGKHARMRHVFMLGAVPGGPLFLHLKARDDDGPGRWRVAIRLNDRALFEGPNAFDDARWQTRRFPIPSGALREGENTVVIANREEAGTVGMPPWFMVAACAIGPETCVIARDIREDFRVTLPAEVRPLPEPLAPGRDPGFKYRGIKGWMWRPEQYLAEIPVLARYKMNFLMNCYTSMCDVEHVPWGDPRCNRWYEPLPASKREAYARIVRACRQSGIEFCFSMNPNLSSSRFVNSGKPEDVDALWQHYAWMQGLGVRWFNISLDDISQGIDAAGQAKVVNEIYRRLRAADADARMIFCPTYYWGDGTGEKQQPYLETLARELHADVYLFWTGDAVVGPITRKSAETFRRIAGHRLFLWDNYPVNDARPTMHLGPVINRDPDLCEVVDGYMSNSMCSQSEMNRVPMLTCADYAWNPWAYDPGRSIGQAIVHLAETPPEREVLKDVVEAYPGMLICGRADTGLNAVREQYTRIASAPHSRYVARMYVRYVERLAARLQSAFPDHYAAAKRTIDDDVAWMNAAYAAKYDLGPEP
jgi:hypothetical protein